MWWDSSTDKRWRGQRGWPSRAELIKLAGYKSRDQPSHTSGKAPWRPEMREASTMLTQVYWAFALDQALNSPLPSCSSNLHTCSVERCWLLFRSRHKAWNGYLNTAPLQGRTRSRIQPAIPLSRRSAPLFSAVVLYILLFLFPVQWMSGRTPLNTVALLPRIRLKLLLHLYSPQDSPELAPGTVGRRQFLRQEKEGAWPCWQCSTLPMDVKAMAVLPNSPMLIFKRDPANAWCLDLWQWCSCPLGWLLEGKP